MPMSNLDKNAHGTSAQNSLKSIFERYKTLGYISDFHTGYRCGKNGYSDKKQFYAPFLLDFSDGEHWIIFSTTSLRDRFKSNLWDAKYIKENIPLTKAYLVYPDGIPNENEFLSKKRKVNSGSGYYTVDDIISQNELINLIENKATASLSVGSKSGILGNKFEERVAALLSYSENLSKWQEDSAVIEGMHFDMFKDIVECFGLPKGDIKTIDADTKIGKIPTRVSKSGKPLGKAKTDVKAKVTYTNGSEEFFTISCKRTGQTEVSVLDYTADQISAVLDKNNSKLHELLVEFQKTGTLSGFGETNSVQLEIELKPYIKKLIFWALGGHYSVGDPETQWANYILTYDTNDKTYSIHRLTDYYTLLTKKENTKHFGTPFQWTFPSNERGKRINVKCKIIK